MTPLRSKVVGGIVLMALLIIFVPTFFKETQSTFHLLSIPNVPLTPSSDHFSAELNNTNPVLNNPFKLLLSPAQAWVLQLADFKENLSAQRFIKTLRTNGFKAYARQISLPTGGNVTRVFVGPEIKSDNIKMLATQLRDKWSLQSTVTVFNPLLLSFNVEKNRKDSL